MAGWMQSWTALAVDHRAVVLDCLPQLLGTVGHRAHLGQKRLAAGVVDSVFALYQRP